MSNKITPCLWFDTQAEEAANFYVSVFKNSRITHIGRMPENDHGFHRERQGTVLTVSFELDGRPFFALNGGPEVKFTEAVSLMIECADQAEVDYFWEKLGTGVDEQCGWLKDRYGLSWQVVPKIFLELIGSGDAEKSRRAFQSMLTLKKLDIATLLRAVEG